MTTWIALFILALAAMLLVSNESGMIAGVDSTTFGYLAFSLALLVFVGGGMLGSYRGRFATIPDSFATPRCGGEANLTKTRGLFR